jgi:hypothetical protein
VSNSAITWAFEQDCDSPVAKLVLVKLADLANADNICWPSMSHLAQHCSCSERTARRIIKKLEQRQLLDVHPRSKNGIKTSNQYWLRIPKAAKASHLKSSTKSDRTQLCPYDRTPEVGVPDTGGNPDRTQLWPIIPQKKPSENLRGLKPKTGDKEPEGELRESGNNLQTFLSEGSYNAKGGAVGMDSDEERRRRGKAIITSLMRSIGTRAAGQ